jgi:hypothetical protein
MSTRKRSVLVAAALSLSALAVPSAASARTDVAADDVQSCAARFDDAQRTDMESFRDFDYDTWVAGHDQNVISIIADGRVRVGLDAVAAAAKARFTAKTSVWSWTELNRQVNGCRTGVIVYNTKYALPHLDYWFTAVTTVTYEYKGGRWLCVLDQGTLLEEHVGNA